MSGFGVLTMSSRALEFWQRMTGVFLLHFQIFYRLNDDNNQIKLHKNNIHTNYQRPNITGTASQQSAGFTQCLRDVSWGVTTERQQQCCGFLIWPIAAKPPTSPRCTDDFRRLFHSTLCRHPRWAEVTNSRFAACCQKKVWFVCSSLAFLINIKAACLSEAETVTSVVWRRES